MLAEIGLKPAQFRRIYPLSVPWIRRGAPPAPAKTTGLLSFPPKDFKKVCLEFHVGIRTDPKVVQNRGQQLRGTPRHTQLQQALRNSNNDALSLGS